ncbi:hypothetical protein PHLGIDRAFT_472476 [Phlebiopsis gigantea 11061_1 CR5-6]|uniref:NADPH-dependent FMN reductase-like domain-containing protein n=1 Tax=Phlebiopsis gigantea (strain 11061_1 CR5-6) TaxID=745531 RepID=A0A0C3S5P1_PHLG1|nr:hypothetical protein PHLGIDRAFT_472476 [Phlebiopsis gigantea 11061_1 CR5-6]
MQSAARLGLLIGSSRPNGNGPGLASWVTQLLDARLNAAAKTLDIVRVDPTQPPHPFGPVVDGAKLPSQVPDSSAYASPAVRQWSRLAASCAAFAVVSPEYNGGYPGELKNALDHLYREWAGKPVVLVTYGGGGGVRCAAQLQTVLASLKMQLVADPVNVRLPSTFTGGPERVPTAGSYPEFLGAYVDAVNGAADKLRDVLLAQPSGKP